MTDLKISLAGDLGSGKSTVTDLLLKATGAERYTTGKIMRDLAAARGMTIDEFNRSIEGNPEVDKLIDDGLRALSDDPRDLVIDSRMAWHFTRGTFRVYMTTEPEIAAARIMAAGREGERFATLDEAVTRIAARRASEKKRYFEFYGVDITDLFNYDLVIDTSYASPEQIAEAILSALSDWQRDETTRACLVCPRRLRYPDDPPDETAIAACDLLIETGKPLPLSDVIFFESGFYLAGDPSVALSVASYDLPFVPCRLVRGQVDGTYIRMENTL